MILLRSRSHAALVAVACVAVLLTSVAHATPLPQKSLNTDISTDFRATKNNGGLDFDFSSSSNFGGGSSNPPSSSSSNFGSSSSGTFGGSTGSFGGGSGTFGGSSGSFGGGSSSGGSQGTQPNFFEQIARTSQLVGSMVSSFFTSLARQSNQNGGSNLSPLVAIDTRSGAPTIDIPGILGLNTGHTRNGGGSSLVSVSTQQGTKVRAPFVNIDSSNGNTRVQAPFTDVNTNKGGTRVQAPFTDVRTNSGGTRVQAPFTDVQTNAGGTRVQAPFTDVQTNAGGTRVQAPFTDVRTNSGGTKVQAPFTDVFTNGGGIRVQAPFTDVQTNAGGTRVQAPFVTVDHRKETNEIIVPSAQRNHITHTGSVFPARSEGNSNFQLTPLSLNSRFSLTSNHLSPPAPKPTRHHPYLRASAPRGSVYQNPAPSRNIQKSKNFRNSAPFTSSTTTTSPSRPGTGNRRKFSTGLAGYERIRFNSNLMPNFFREMNPSPNDIPDTLIRKGYNTPHKVRMYVIDKATEMMEKAKIVR